MAKSVDIVNLLRVAVARGVMKREPHCWMRLIMKESTARFVKCLGDLAERYRHRPVWSSWFRVVSFHGFIVEAIGRVFLVR